MTLAEIKREQRCETDKPCWYLETYEHFFAPLRGAAIRLLEIGVREGESLRLWHAYFWEASIHGIDNQPVKAERAVRLRNLGITVHLADQSDQAELKRISTEAAPGGWDIIIDDGSHVAKDAAASFEALFGNHLKSGGLYCIEDWFFGYLDRCPDGRRPTVSATRFASQENDYPSHQAGMVGWLKQLVDECGLRRTSIASMRIERGLAILRKQ